MACQLCGMRTSSNLCQVCQFLSELALPEDSPVCRHCQAPIANPAATGRLCRLCRDLQAVVRNNPWLAYAHTTWDQENLILAKRKRELLG